MYMERERERECHTYKHTSISSGAARECGSAGAALEASGGTEADLLTSDLEGEGQSKVRPISVLRLWISEGLTQAQS